MSQQALAKSQNNRPSTAQQGKSAAHLSLSPSQKAAIIIVSLGADIAKTLLAEFDDQRMQGLLKAYAEIDNIDRETIIAVVADFIQNLDALDGSLSGGEQAARQLAESIIDSERATRLLGPEVIRAPGDEPTVWELLPQCERPALLTYLETKAPEMIAIILSKLKPQFASEILSLLSDENRAVCARILSRKVDINTATLTAIEKMLQSEILSAETSNPDDEAAQYMGDVLSVLPAQKRQTILDDLSKDDPEQVDRIKAYMMTVEDLPERLPVSAVSILFREIPNEKLVVTLKAIDKDYPQVSEFFFANISQRMAGQFKEQMEDMEPLTPEKNDAAMTAMLGYVGDLESRGKITLIRPDTT